MTLVTIRTAFDPQQLVTQDVAPKEPAPKPFHSRSRLNDAYVIRQALHARAQRGQFFNERLFFDPAWDMLLELYVASIVERRMSVSRLCERSGVPSTTALRWIKTLEQEGLIDRYPDKLDGRRIYLALSDKGFRKMSAYLDQLHAETKLL